jgi:type I restriction enzyme M protein
VPDLTQLGPFSSTDNESGLLKSDPKHGVSEEIYEAFKGKADVRPRDILMVRDGTYLIGTAAMVSEHDGRILFQSHIHRIRVLDEAKLDPYLLFAALNSSIVKRQIRSKQFTQDIIDTLGNRLREVAVPLPKDPELRKSITERTREVVEERARLRKEARDIARAVEGAEGGDEDFFVLN